MKKLLSTKTIKAILAMALAIAFVAVVVPRDVFSHAYSRATKYMLGKNVIGPTGYFDRLRAGTGSTSGHSFGADDIYVEGDAEIDGVLYADGGIVGAITSGGVNLSDSEAINVGTGIDLKILSDGDDVFFSTTIAQTRWWFGAASGLALVEGDIRIPGSSTSIYWEKDGSADQINLVGMTWVSDSNVTTTGTVATSVFTASSTATITDTATMNGDVVLGNAPTDDITMGGSLDGTRFQQTVVDLDDASASTNWTVSDTVNWTVAVGSSNSRSGGNVLEFKTDNTVDDYLELDMGSVTDLTGVNFLGFFLEQPGGTIAADELDVDLLTAASTVMTNCAGLQVPAIAQTDWTFVEFDITTCANKDRFQFLRLAADTGITSNSLINIQSFLTYRVSNGNGPVNGAMVYYPVSSGTVTRGEIACNVEVGVNPTGIGVQSAAANCTSPMGIATNTSTTWARLQTTGVAIMEASAGVADNAAVQASAATTVDDAGGAQDAIGYARESAADANDFIEIRLQFH